MSNPTSTPEHPQPTNIESTGNEASRAFDESAAARSALDPSSFASLTVDVAHAVDVVLAALPRLRKLQRKSANMAIDPALIVQLETFALATAHAQALLEIATAPPNELDAVHKQAVERRNALKLEASVLARYGLLHRATVEALKSENGYRNVAYDLLSLVELFRQAQDRLVGRTITRPDELAGIAALATQLLKLAAVRQARRTLTAAAKEERLRAFTLMHNAYSQARRAVHFVCWDEGDASAIAPSFYGPHSGRRRQERPAGTSAPSLELNTTVHATEAESAAPVPSVAHDSMPGDPQDTAPSAPNVSTSGLAPPSSDGTRDRPLRRSAGWLRSSTSDRLTRTSPRYVRR